MSAGGEQISGRGHCRDHWWKVRYSQGPIANQAPGLQLHNIRIRIYSWLFISNHRSTDQCNEVWEHLRSFTLAPLLAKGPSIGVLPLDYGFRMSPTPIKLLVSLESANCYSRFVVRSFFVGPIDQTHVNTVMEKFGGPKMKATIVELVLFICTSFTCPTSVQVNGSRKSVTLSWSKHGGLGESLGDPNISWGAGTS